MQAQSWFNRAHVEQSKQAPGQLERKIRQEKSHFYPIPFLKVYIMIFIEKSDSKFGGLKKDLNIIFSQEKLPAEFRRYGGHRVASVHVRGRQPVGPEPADWLLEPALPVGERVGLLHEEGRPGCLRHPSMERKRSQHADCGGCRGEPGDDGQPLHVHAPSHPAALLFLCRT